MHVCVCVWGGGCLCDEMSISLCICKCVCLCVLAMKWAYPYVFVSDPGSWTWCSISNILSSFHSLCCARCAARRAVCGKRCTAWTCRWSNSYTWWKDCCTSHTRCTAAASRLCGDSIETLLCTALATDLSCPYGDTAPFMGRLCLCWSEQLLCCSFCESCIQHIVLFQYLSAVIFCWISMKGEYLSHIVPEFKSNQHEFKTHSQSQGNQATLWSLSSVQQGFLTFGS